MHILFEPARCSRLNAKFFFMYRVYLPKVFMWMCVQAFVARTLFGIQLEKKPLELTVEKAWAWAVFDKRKVSNKHDTTLWRLLKNTARPHDCCSWFCSIKMTDKDRVIRHSIYALQSCFYLVCTCLFDGMTIFHLTAHSLRENIWAGLSSTFIIKPDQIENTKMMWPEHRHPWFYFLSWGAWRDANVLCGAKAM